MGNENNEVGTMPTSYCLTFMCCQPCLPNFQCFLSCVPWTPFCIFSFCYVSHAVVSGNVTLSGRILGWIKCTYYKLAEYDDVIRVASF